MTDAATITAAINAKFATPAVLTFEQSQTATKSHIVVFVSRRYVADRLGSGEVTIPGGRVVARYVSLTEANVDVYRDRVKAALEDQILAGDLGPFTFETTDMTNLEVRSAVNWFISSDTFTY